MLTSFPIGVVTDFRPRLRRPLRGQGRPRHRGRACRRSSLRPGAPVRRVIPDERAADRGDAARPRRCRALLADSDHGRHRPDAARRHAGGDRGGLRAPDAGLRRIDAHAQPAGSPTAILSRQTAGLRGRSLIVNLPGKPSAIRTCLDAVFPAIPYCLDLIGGPPEHTQKPGPFREDVRARDPRAHASLFPTSQMGQNGDRRGGGRASLPSRRPLARKPLFGYANSQRFDVAKIIASFRPDCPAELSRSSIGRCR